MALLKSIRAGYEAERVRLQKDAVGVVIGRAVANAKLHNQKSYKYP
jgi:hypothetical protein